MNYPKIILAFASILALFLLIDYNKNKIFSSYVDTENLCASISRAWVKPKNTDSILQNYPFPLLEPPVTIAEGFEAYDGTLGDPVGAYHWAIDYVQIKDGKYLEFPVYSTHEGIAFQGFGKTWGKFVVVRYRDGSDRGYNTLYSHLDNIPKTIPFLNSDFDTSRGIFVKAGTYIGDASTTGNTKGISQLHFEFHLFNTENKSTVRIDPYGLYQRLSSKLYPAPGDSLEGLSHYWYSNFPSFASTTEVSSIR